MPSLLSSRPGIIFRTRNRNTRPLEGTATCRRELGSRHRQRTPESRARDPHLQCDALQRSLSWNRSSCQRCSWTPSWSVLLLSILVAEPVRPAEGSCRSRVPSRQLLSVHTPASTVWIRPAGDALGY